MTDEECELIIEKVWWHLANCDLDDCIIDIIGVFIKELDVR